MSVTPEYLLKGYALALEQCGLLLRDACQLYESGSFATAIVLAVFAREELGRPQDLLDYWRRRVSGTPVTAEEVKAAGLSHLKKQRAGMLSLTMRPEHGSDHAKILAARTAYANNPLSQEWQDADAELKKYDAELTERTPSDRHEQRMAALYVEPKSDTEWNRPADTPAKAAYEFLVDALNDYRGRYNRLPEDDPELYRSLEQMADRPTLWAPVHPSWPG